MSRQHLEDFWWSAVCPALFIVAVAMIITTGAFMYKEANSGWAVYYRKGMMEIVEAKRVLWGQIPPGTPHYDGYASTTECGQIGHYITISLQNPQTDEWTPKKVLLIVDCSAPADRQRHIDNNQLVEVDYSLAESAHFIVEGRAKVRLYGLK